MNCVPTESVCSFSFNKCYNASPGGAALAQLVSPSQTILVIEQVGNVQDPEVYGADLKTDGTGVQLLNHLSTSNYLFCDGHAKSLRATATITPTNLWLINNAAAPTAFKNAIGAQQVAMN